MGGLIGIAFMLLVMGGVAAVIVYAVRSFTRGSYPASPMGPGPGADRALAILRERYARGEVDQAEYEERRGRLTSAWFG